MVGTRKLEKKKLSAKWRLLTKEVHCFQLFVNGFEFLKNRRNGNFLFFVGLYQRGIYEENSCQTSRKSVHWNLRFCDKRFEKSSLEKNALKVFKLVSGGLTDKIVHIAYISSNPFEEIFLNI